MSEEPSSRRSHDLLVAIPFLVVAGACALLAFIGLSSASYRIDELFTLFIINHGGGLSEVLRRALTDTHPPGFYVLTYGWLQLFGSSETAMRAFCALAGVAVLPVLFFGLRHVFSLPARAFAVAMAAGSKLFFQQTQNIRSHSLCVLWGSVLLVLTLAIHRRARTDRPASLALAAGFWLASLGASFTHFYVFLAVGGAHLFLLLTARTWRGRGAVVASGLSILALMGAYAAVLLGSSKQNLQNMWFSNSVQFLGKELTNGLGQSWGAFALAALAVLAAGLWLRWRRGETVRPAGERGAAVLLSCLVIVLTIAAGLVVSFTVAPSFGSRNISVLGPYLWVIAAALFDAAALDPRRPGGQVMLGLLVILAVASALPNRARLAPTAEEWRGSAAYVAGRNACAGQPIPVVLPFIFGPSTPFFRDLARQYFFGRYYADRANLHPYLPREFRQDPQLKALLQARVAGAGCPVLAWGVHDLKDDDIARLRSDIAQAAGVPETQVAVRSFPYAKVNFLGTVKLKPSAWVLEAIPPSAR